MRRGRVYYCNYSLYGFDSEYSLCRQPAKANGDSPCGLFLPLGRHVHRVELVEHPSGTLRSIDGGTAEVVREPAE